GVLADLDRLRRAARQAGGPLTPPPHVWLQVAGQIHRERPLAPPPARTKPVWQWVGIAATLLLVTIGIYVVQRIPTNDPSTATATAVPAGSVQVIAGEL